MTTRTVAALMAGGLLLAGCKAAPDNATAAAAADGTAAATATGTLATTGPAPVSFAAGKWAMTAEITDVAATGAEGKDQAELAQLRSALAGKPQTKEICVSQADVDGGLEKLFVTEGANCTTDTKQLAGGVINSTYTCKTANGGGAQIKTAGGYTADTMTTSTRIQTPGPKAGTSLTLTAKTIGKRLGAC